MAGSTPPAKLLQFSRISSRQAKISRGEVGAMALIRQPQILGLTALGSRHNQEDAIAAFTHGGMLYAIVADGMGGHGEGEIASHMTVRNFRRAIMNGLTIEDAIRQSHDYIIKYMAHHPSLKAKGMGTTVSAAMIAKDKITIAHSGDSPIYLAKRDGTILLGALPHIALLNELGKDWIANVLPDEISGMLIQLQAILRTSPNPPYPERTIDLLLDSESQLRSSNLNQSAVNSLLALRSALGFELPDGTPTVTQLEGFSPGDRLIIASDGLNLRTPELRSILSQNLPADETARRLVEKRGEYGDNISVVIYENMESEAAHLQARVKRLELDNEILRGTNGDLRNDKFRLQDEISSMAQPPVATAQEIEDILNGNSEISSQTARDMIDRINRFAAQNTDDQAAVADRAIRMITKILGEWSNIGGVE